MGNSCSCKSIAVYKKTDPNEIINKGDVIMLDVESATVKKAVSNDFKDMMLNTRLVVGVCVESNNSEKMLDIVDGGMSDNEEAELLDGGTSFRDETEYEIIVIEGADATQSKRELIKVAYSGQQLVNICGYVDIGDKLCISEHAGKAKSLNYFEKGYFGLRSIGKVIKYTNSENQVKVLLDIE